MAARDPELTRLLILELERHLVAVEAESGKRDDAALESVRRAVHALKGSAGLAGEPELASTMQRLERRLRDGDETALDDVAHAIRHGIRRISTGETTPGWPVPPPDLVPTALDASLRVDYVTEVMDRLHQIDRVLAMVSDPIDAAAMLYRHVHTMKGAASAVGDDVTAWFCHGLEERLRAGTATRESAVAALHDVATYRAVLGGLIEEPEAVLASLRGLPFRARMPYAVTARPSVVTDEEARLAETDATIRVSAQAVDRLLDHVGAITVARERVAYRVTRATALSDALRRMRGDLNEALRLIGPPRPWGAPAAALRRVERASHSLSELGDEIDRVSEDLDKSDHSLKDNARLAKKLLATMRQTAIRDMFGRLASASMAEARRNDRLLVTRTVGAEEPIDRRLAEQLVEPLLQLTRNAIAHGIEPPEVRAQLGKPPEATITFKARRLANRLVVTISDDGAGVDVAALRARAVETGIVTEVLAEAADDETLLELLFLPGFSTRAQSPDLLAGRGIGLDITLASVQKLGGSIRLSSRLSRGFEARVDIPIESGLATILWVHAGGVEHALPAVHTCAVRLNEGPDAERVPHLAACLEAVVVERAPYVVELDVGLDAPERLAVGVDAVGVPEEVLIRELSPLLRGIGPYSGGIMRGDGSLRLALDVHALAPRVRALGRVPEGRVSQPPSRSSPPSRPPSSRPPSSRQGV